jgi:hypothetical protein
MNEFIRNHKKEIVLFILTVLIAIFSSYLSSLGEKLVDLIAKFSSSQADKICKRAARDDSFVVIHFFAYLTISCGFAFSLVRIASLGRRIRQIWDPAQNKKGFISRLLENISERGAFNILLVVFIFTVAWVYGIFITELTVYKMNVQFKQHLRILAPYIPEPDIKSLNSKWAMMQSDKDLVAINAEIKKLQQAHNLPVK